MSEDRFYQRRHAAASAYSRRLAFNEPFIARNESDTSIEGKAQGTGAKKEEGRNGEEFHSPLRPALSPLCKLARRRFRWSLENFARPVAPASLAASRFASHASKPLLFARGPARGVRTFGRRPLRVVDARRAYRFDAICGRSRPIFVFPVVTLAAPAGSLRRTDRRSLSSFGLARSLRNGGGVRAFAFVRALLLLRLARGGLRAPSVSGCRRRRALRRSDLRCGLLSDRLIRT